VRAAACVDVHIEQQLLLLLLMSTAVAAGLTGIATVGIARMWLTQIAAECCSYSIVSAVVVVVGMVIN
jgi:hypothetical protein